MTREEALAILRKENGVVYSEYEEVVDVIEKALVDRPHGEWKLRSPYEAWFEEYKCSNCNAYGWFNWHFCPNCGADMRKEEEGEAE